MGKLFLQIPHTKKPIIKTSKSDLTKPYIETTKCHHQIKHNLTKPYTEKSKVYHKAKSYTETLKGSHQFKQRILDQTPKKTKFITKPKNHKTKSNTIPWQKQITF